MSSSRTKLERSSSESNNTVNTRRSIVPSLALALLLAARPELDGDDDDDTNAPSPDVALEVMAAECEAAAVGFRPASDTVSSERSDAMMAATPRTRAAAASGSDRSTTASLHTRRRRDSLLRTALRSSCISA